MSVAESMTGDERATLRVELEDRLFRLALEEDVLKDAGDTAARAELADVRSEIKAAKSELGDLLGQERNERVAAEARDAEAAERKRAALVRAQELQGDRVKLAAAVDNAAEEYAKALRAWDRVTTSQEVALREAGRDATAARPRPWQTEGGLQFALMQANVPPGAIKLGSFSGGGLSLARAQPLAEIDSRPI